MNYTSENPSEFGAEDNLQKPISYTFDRRAFLDVIWNRIQFVEFRPWHHNGSVFPVPQYKDHFGRVKVCLLIDSNNPPDVQAETLVHESIHVDRTAWKRNTDIPFWSDEFITARTIEENITDVASKAFYEDHKPLALKALNYLKRRSPPKKN